MKACAKCGVVKGLEEFPRRHDTADGRNARCKICISAYESRRRPEARMMREALAGGAQLSWGGCDIDGGDFHDLMVKHGLFVEVPADDEFKEEWDLDMMFVLKWSDEARTILGKKSGE